MNKGVEILLARMDSNPEEFEINGGWTTLYNEYKKFMEPEEQEAVVTKLKQIKMAKFEKDVLKRLLRDENAGKFEVGSVFYQNGQLNAVVSPAGGGGGTGAGNAGGGGGGSGTVIVSTPTSNITFSSKDRAVWGNTSSSLSHESLTIGNTKLTEETLATLVEQVEGISL